MFNNFYNVGQNIMKPISAPLLQWYQKHGKRHHDLGDLIMTNIKKKNLPS
jgi:hypothetical protein